MGSPVDSRDRKADNQVEAYGNQSALEISSVPLIDHQDCSEEPEDRSGCAYGVSIEWQKKRRRK